MKNFLPGICVSLLTLLLYHPQAFAASLSTIGIPSTIDQSQELSANITLSSCSGCSDSYLRGVFYPSGTSYFGYTQDNGGNWSNASGGSCTTYFKVAQSDLQGGSWSGSLKFKPDSTSPYYNGPGEYLFKVGRYTPSCGSPSVWSTETTIAITGPTPSPSPLPTSTSTPTPTPSPTPSPSIKPTVKPTVAPTISPTKISLKTTSPTTSVAGEYDVSAPEDKISKNPSSAVLESNNSGQPSLIFKIFLLAGGILLLASVLFFLPQILERFFNKKAV